MPALFSRTSTHRVLELYLEYKTLDAEFLTKKLNEKGHNRKVSDVRTMLRDLVNAGIIGNKYGEELVRVVRGIKNPEDPSPPDIYVASIFLEHLMENGLAVLPFLEAVRDYPNKNKMIQVYTVEYGPKYGFYNLREGDDVSAAMGNFLSFLGFLKNRFSGKKGRYELSALGRILVGERSEYFVEKRIKCDHGEPCREVCPVNAISFDKISNSCIQCGLCTRACPYGAITLVCDSGKEKIVLNTDICEAHSGQERLYPPCNVSPITAEEISMQFWIKSLLRLGQLRAEIPGVGEYPDLVTVEIPSFIEVKKLPFTEKRANRLIEEQIPRYMTEDRIKATIEQVKKRKNVEIEKPEFFVIVAPTSKTVEYLLEVAQKRYGELIRYPISFLPFEDLYEASILLLEGEKIDFKREVWEKMQPWKENKFFIK